ncbi:unnamed protein product [Penicillium camemberti]|uniref:Str. FM013 n=1 Tax=Penicillium camemberti (strain FM 013) TaxID=1429867 RepID=A0A0G4NWM2_PENC3|nr:unnamed protein product [Penicillium camemberti]
MFKMQGSQLGKPTLALQLMIGVFRGGRISPRRRGTCSSTAGEEKASEWFGIIF